MWVVLLFFGGEEEIRTLGGVAPSTVFKTAALNRSATSPFQHFQSGSAENRIKLRFIDDFGSTRKFFGIFSLAYLRLRFDSKTALIKPLCHLFVLVEFMLLRNINLYWIALANTSCLFTYLFDDVKHYLENCNILSVYGCALAVVSFK